MKATDNYDKLVSELTNEYLSLSDNVMTQFNFLDQIEKLGYQIAMDTFKQIIIKLETELRTLDKELDSYNN